MQKQTKYLELLQEFGLEVVESYVTENYRGVPIKFTMSLPNSFDLTILSFDSHETQHKFTVFQFSRPLRWSENYTCAINDNDCHINGTHKKPACYSLDVLPTVLKCLKQIN